MTMLVATKTVRQRRWSLTGAVAALAFAALASASDARAADAAFRPAVSSARGVVSSASLQASAVGIDVLNHGGNAMDAAVATVFALGVSRPDMCGNGGEGLLTYRTAAGEVATLDFLGTIAKAASWETLDGPLYAENVGHLAATVPGTVAGMAAALERYGTLSLHDAIAPAERMARDGIIVSWRLAETMFGAREWLRLYPESRRTFLLGDAPYPPGSTLVQTDLADTLAEIMEGGPDVFYKGRIAHAIADDMASASDASATNPLIIQKYGLGTRDPGQITYDDMASYEAIWRTPTVTTYRGRQVVTAPAPSQGGIEVAEMLNVLEGYDLAGFGHGSADEIHVLAEAEKLAWADGLQHVGDPAYVPDDTRMLTSKHYAAEQRARIDMEQAQQFAPGDVTPGPARKTPTTTMSVIDAAGNAATVTCTEVQAFGSKVVVPGTGVLLDSDTSFSEASRGTADQPWGGNRVGAWLAPTIVVDHGRPLAVGGAGGDYIPIMVAQTIVNTVDHGMDLAHAVDAARMHAAGPSAMPLHLEDARMSPSVLDELRSRGHVLASDGAYAYWHLVSAVATDATGMHVGVSDPRDEWGAVTQESDTTDTPAREIAQDPHDLPAEPAWPFPS
jgi:gamma-glutamyltranspeptidase/glutathione hydrolase